MDVVASTIEAEQGCPKHTPRLALWRDLGMQTGGYISKGRRKSTKQTTEEEWFHLSEFERPDGLGHAVTARHAPWHDKSHKFAHTV